MVWTKRGGQGRSENGHIFRKIEAYLTFLNTPQVERHYDLILNAILDLALSDIITSRAHKSAYLAFSRS
jgi:hypothetical protein